MKISDISYYLFESYKDAVEKFSQEEDKETVNQYIDSFKQLAKKGIVTGQEKDIGYWIKQGWDGFKEFVNNKSQEKTQSQVKKFKKKDAIIAHDDDKKMVVIPLSKDASCFYGKNTKWCTSSTESENLFYEYIFILNMFVGYYFDKTKNTKYAFVTSFKENSNAFYLYDDQNTRYRGYELEQLGISKDFIIEVIEPYKSELKNYFDINNLDDETQIKLIYNEDKMGPTEYPRIIKYIDSPSTEVQKYAVEKNPLYIAFIDNPSNEIQKLAVSKHERAIDRISNPSYQTMDHHNEIWDEKRPEEKDSGDDLPELTDEEMDDLDNFVNSLG